MGLTEEEATVAGAADGTDIVMAVQEYGSTAYGWAMEDSEGMVKLIAEKSTGRLLGAHIVGHEASILIQPLVQAMCLSTPVHDSPADPYWIHPALTEVVENALLALDVDVPGRRSAVGVPAPEVYARAGLSAAVTARAADGCDQFPERLLRVVVRDDPGVRRVLPQVPGSPPRWSPSAAASPTSTSTVAGGWRTPACPAATPAAK